MATPYIDINAQTISNSILYHVYVMTQVHPRHFQLWKASYKNHLCYNTPFHNLKLMHLKPTQKPKHKTTPKKTHNKVFYEKTHYTIIWRWCHTSMPQSKGHKRCDDLPQLVFQNSISFIIGLFVSVFNFD